jgi:hypothetical protein
VTSRTRLLQVAYLVVLAAVAILTTPSGLTAQKIVPCNICVSQCEDAAQACQSICEAGTTVQWQCFGNQPCTGQGGGTYAASVICTVSVP